VRFDARPALGQSCGKVSGRAGGYFFSFFGLLRESSSGLSWLDATFILRAQPQIAIPILHAHSQ